MGDPLEAAHCDALADALSGMMHAVYEGLYEEGDKGEQARGFKEDLYPKSLRPVLKRMEERLANREYYASNKMTWVDLMISMMFSGMRTKNEEVLKGFPAVEAHVDKVLTNPKIKAWEEAQPKNLPF